jgi:hypothetical protein
VKAPCPSIDRRGKGGLVGSGSSSGGSLSSFVFLCRRWKNKKLLFSLDLCATVSDLLGDDVSVSVTWILTALVESQVVVRIREIVDCIAIDR